MKRTPIDKIKDTLMEEYKNGATVEQLRKKYHKDGKIIATNLKTWFNINRLCPYGIPNTTLDIIDSTDKAYILGFIAADGAIIGNALTITVKYTDKSVVEYIRDIIQPSGNLLEIKRASSFDATKQIHHIRFSHSNKHLINSIKSYGILPNKSLTMENIIYNIPKEFRPAFIIGYFDGDGSISLPKPRLEYKSPNKTQIVYPSHRITLNFRGTYEFLSGIKSELELEVNIHKYDSIPTLSIGNKKDIVKFFNYYKGLNFFLERKYNKFFPRINHPSYDIYK